MKAEVKNKLKELSKEINDKYARGQVDSHRQLVTLQVDNVAESWKEGYQKFLDKHKDKPFPDGNDWDWVSAVRSRWEEIKTASTSKRNHVLVEEGPDYFVFAQNQFSKDTFDAIKEFSVEFIQSNLKDYKLTGAKEEAALAGAPDSQIKQFAGQSDVGKIKTPQVRAHIGKTTVGAARLVLSMKWLSKTRFFKEFTASKEAKALEDKYGEIFYIFESSGTKKRGLKLKIKEDVSLAVVAGSTNYPGSEALDWGGSSGVGRNLEKAIYSWASRQPIEDWKGSPSIAENAEEAVAYEMDQAVKGKGRRTTGTVAKNRKRPSRSDPYSAAPKKKTAKTKKTVQKRKLKAKSSTAKKADRTPITLFALLNAKLSQTVQKNMGAPRLENRSGRFASSVRVTDVSKTPQGFLSVGYSYQRNPYQVFESTSGTRFSSIERDPREIIDYSIRELAATMVAARLYTRRM